MSYAKFLQALHCFTYMLSEEKNGHFLLFNLLGLVSTYAFEKRPYIRLMPYF